MAINKVVYGGRALIDLTSDTVTEDKLLEGAIAHGKDGETITGTCTFDVDSNDATIAVAEILAGKTAYARGAKLTGTMPNNGSVNGVISTKEGSYTVPQGYHDGSGKASIDLVEQAKIIPDNIRSGITILGVEGTMGDADEVRYQNKSVVPTTTRQTVLPDDGYHYLSQVTVDAIPYVESDNSAGGVTVTIG